MRKVANVVTEGGVRCFGKRTHKSVGARENKACSEHLVAGACG